MVDDTSSSRIQIEATQFTLRITIFASDMHARDTLMAALEPEYPAINSKRVKLLVKLNQHNIVFHLAANDVTALRAAATSLIRLYSVADGVLQLMVKKND
jgi:tRNA threonylcarbamoyladenosine modification (KEOPS) complex  Pcc1 subunit